MDALIYAVRIWAGSGRRNDARDTARSALLSAFEAQRQRITELMTECYEAKARLSRVERLAEPGMVGDLDKCLHVRALLRDLRAALAAKEEGR